MLWILLVHPKSKNILIRHYLEIGLILMTLGDIYTDFAKLIMGVKSE